MKALVATQFGPPERLIFKEVEKPKLKENEVLIKIHSTSVNDYDWSMVIGKPYLYRLLFGFFKPRRPIPGMELAGTIEEVGTKVEKLKIGDEVYGDTSDHGFGTFAEYIAINENAVVPKPNFMSFEDATSLPHASHLAYQGLFTIGNLQEGQNILINGAGGGVGTLAFQMAKQMKCTITGVDTGDKLETMREMGFDFVLDYKKIDFTKQRIEYDLILDTRTTRRMRSLSKAITKDGIFVTVGGTIPSLLNLYFFKRFFKKKMTILALKANKNHKKIEEWYESGIIKPVIDGPHPFSSSPKAIRRFGDAVHCGKVVVSMI